ncbi:MAG: hypothetical protein ACFCUM_06255 [Bacteroidales bacterium]
MFKRIILIFLVAGALVFLAAGYFYMRRILITGTDPISAVPPDAAVIVRAGSITGFLSAIRNNQDLWSETGTVLNSHDLEASVSYLDSIINYHPQASLLAAGKGMLISMNPVSRDNYQAVFYTGLSSYREIKAFNQAMHDMIGSQAVISERVYDRVKVYDAVFNKSAGMQDITWAISDGVFILSYSAILVENSIRQLFSGKSLLEDDGFNKVLSTSGRNVDADIFFNLKLFPRYISSFIQGKGKRLLSGFTVLGNWALLDLHMRDNTMILNGFSFSDRSQNNYLNIFQGQSPETINVESVVPGYSSAFLALGLSDIPGFYHNYNQWLSSTGKVAHHNEMKERFIYLTGSDPFEVFHSLIDIEVALVMTGWEKAGDDGQTFLLMKTKSSSQTRDALLEMLRHHASLTGDDAGSYRNVYNVDSETSFDIYSFPYLNTGELLFGEIFGAAETSYFSFVGNYLVFGESENGISEFIHANVLNQTLSADTRFREFSEYLSSRNNFYFYSNMPRSAGLFSLLANEDLSENLANNIESYRKFQAMSVQFGSGRDMVYNNLFLRYSPEIIEEAHTEWQTLLDTVIDFKPVFLVNHNTGENEIFVQDLNNTIYLINQAGRILWKKPVEGKILGNVHQIDFFNNSRLQIMFNTREQIFLVDRNGNDVGRYPLRLPSPATNGISVFDYENNKDYRIFVACEDNSVVVRSKDGNIISGWDFKGTEHSVYHEIKYFRIDGRDYIVFNDRQRIYMLDRRGNVRVSPDKIFPVSSRNTIIFEGRTPSSDPRIAITDTTGVIWHIYFDGKTETLKLGEYSAGHFFDFQDINANGYKDYIFIDSTRLEVFNHDGSVMFSHEFPVPIIHSPSYYHFSRQNRKIGVVASGLGQIFLINSDGELYHGFPLIGRSPFTIGFLQSGQGNFQLIVGSDNNFLYNYSVYQFPG